MSLSFDLRSTKTDRTFPATIDAVAWHLSSKFDAPGTIDVKQMLDLEGITDVHVTTFTADNLARRLPKPSRSRLSLGLDVES